MPTLTLPPPTGPVRLHYIWSNPDGGAADPARPTLAFLHDGLGAIGAWRDVPARLVARLGANALLYDRWGYGASSPRADFPPGFLEGEVPLLEALRVHLDVPRLHLIGHSDGGSIALLYAAVHPRRVGALVTVAAHTFVEPLTRSGLRDLLARLGQAEGPGLLGHLHGERAGDLLRAWSDLWLSATHARWDMRPVLARVRAPLLAVQGTADEYGTQAQVDALTGAVPGAAAWLVPGCGHAPHLERPDAFAERAARFLAPHVQSGGWAGAR